MISNKDRSNYFGASDTKYIVGNWNTKTFQNWWLTKIGIMQNKFENKYTMAGTNYEHKILDALNIDGLEKDNQVIVDRLRVNLDGNTKRKIYEIKTYNYEKGFKVSKDYEQQVLVQMYVTGIKDAEIVAYGLVESDYNNYLHNIDKERLSFHKIIYDEKFLNTEYVPKLEYLTECLKKGSMPKMEEFDERRKRKT